MRQQYSHAIQRLNRLKGRLLVCLLGMSLVFSGNSMAEEPAVDYTVRDYKIEAAFLYNFFNYITWPGYHNPEDLKQATICIYGEDRIAAYLEYIRLKIANERQLVIQILQADELPQNCQVLFIRKADDTVFQLLSSPVEGVLVVGTIPGFTDKGGMISLIHEQNRIAMDIDNSALTQAGFHVSSRLLDLARKVK